MKVLISSEVLYRGPETGWVALIGALLTCHVPKRDGVALIRNRESGILLFFILIIKIEVKGSRIQDVVTATVVTVTVVTVVAVLTSIII